MTGVSPVTPAPGAQDVVQYPRQGRAGGIWGGVGMPGGSCRWHLGGADMPGGSCRWHLGGADMPGRVVPVASGWRRYARLSADKTGLSKAQMGRVLDELANLAYGEAKNGFVIPGIGKLVLVNRKARVGRNPATGEAIQIPAKTVVKFRVAKVCKDSVLSK